MRSWFTHLTLVLVAVFYAAILGAPLASAANSYQVNSGQQLVIDEWSICRVVTNNAGKPIFVPTKSAAEWSAFYNNPPANVASPACASCTLDGASVPHGSSATFYASTRSCYSSCASISQVRSCYNGTLDGSATYSKAACPAESCASCTTQNKGWSTNPYNCSASVTAGSHNTVRNVSDSAAPGVGSASYTCANGSWNQNSGTCSGASCSLPWGGSINNGQSTTAYAASSVPCGSSCSSQTRTCSDGTLSGSYTKQSCSVSACASCSLPWGGSIAHNASVTAYQSSSVACGGSCTSQTRSCNNGSLSGSYANSGCSVASCGCTLPWGGSISSGQSVTAYQSSSVACGSSCVSETRTCSGTTLSGSYTKQSCSVGACANCTAPNGQAVSHGSCLTRYEGTSYNKCGGLCETCNMHKMSFCCNNGTMSNVASWSSYPFTSCTTTCTTGQACF